MRIHRNLVTGIQGAICICFILGFAGCSTTSTNQDLVLEELKGIRSSLDQMNEELLRQEESRQKLLSFTSKYGSSSSREVNYDKLADVALPEDPNDEDVKDYINAIKVASAGQRGVSNSDPQVEMLKEVGSENIPLLIDALLEGGQHYPFRYHAIHAVQGLVTEAHKALILESLVREQRLAGIVLAKGWEHDAHDILVEGLKSRQRLEMDWIKAVASLEDPETYPLLRDYFINGENVHWVYEIIKDLPIEDMDGAVAQAWKNSQYSHEYSRQKMAMIAVEYGHMDALEYLIETLESPSSTTHSHTLVDIRLLVTRSTGLSDGNEKIAAWFENNRDRLEFDPEARKFVVGATADGVAETESGQEM